MALIRDNGSYDLNLEMILSVVDPKNEIESRLTKFDLILHSIDNMDDYASEILNVTDDVLIVEKLFEAIEYVVPRSLNRCLTTIKNMEILSYVTEHPFARFNIAYCSFEPLRMAVLNMDLHRLRVFISSYGNRVNINDRGLTTMGKSALGLAVAFGYDNIILMFHESGLQFDKQILTPDELSYIQRVVRDRAVVRCQLFSDIVINFIDTGEVDSKLMGSLLSYNCNPLTVITTLATINDSLATGIAKNTRLHTSSPLLSAADAGT